MGALCKCVRKNRQIFISFSKNVLAMSIFSKKERKNIKKIKKTIAILKEIC